MKKNIFKILSLVLTLALVFGIMAVPASAYDVEPMLIVGGVEMNDGDYLASGATEVSSKAPAEGGYAYYKDGVLTLNDYVYEGEGYTYYDDGTYVYTSAIYSATFLTIELVGDSSITNTESGSDGITSDGGLRIYGDGIISIIADYGIYADVYSAETAEIIIDGGLIHFSMADTAIYLCGNNGDAVITVNDGSVVCESNYGICAESSIEYGLASVVINGGEVISDGNTSETLYAYAYAGTSEITVNGGYILAAGELYAVFADKISINGGIVVAEALNEAEGAAINGELVMGENVVITVESEDGLYLATHFTYYAGDANGDRVIDMFDYLLIKGIYFESVDYSYEEFVRADANCDGLVDMFDYLIVKSAYFTGEEPTLLPDAYAPDPVPDTAYAKLYNYILANGTVDADNETYYTISSEPATNDDTGEVFATIIGTYSDSVECIELGGVITSPDGAQMLVVAIALAEGTTEYDTMTLYLVDSNATAMGMGTVIAGGCVDGAIDILNFDGTVSDGMTLGELEAAAEEVLYASLASIEGMIADAGVSLADFGFDCFAEPI